MWGNGVGQRLAPLREKVPTGAVDINPSQSVAVVAKGRSTSARGHCSYAM
ncbi:hypothetical protein SacmaDRAFT_1601 [Saccharomonospora marina XMU15]|uniref:Uncharacterized protein n=1 Tax=Saccharomonospora marina XMU15 TaxID=882083 RepID=H5X3E2_9PSEU|nr:hypothetical protein SacmaDRAFT_1601 [Saccharomonospora marina XMU15]